MEGEVAEPARGAYRWVVLMLATAAQAGTAAIVQGVAALLPFIRADLGLSRAEAGVLAGSVNIGQMATLILAGRLVDAFSERWVLTVGGVLTGLATLAASRAGAYGPLVVLLVVAGLAYSVSTPAGSKSVMQWFPRSMRSLAMGVRQTGIPMGGVFAAIVLPPAAALWGWRWGLAIAGGAAIVTALAYGALYREPAPCRVEGAAPNRPAPVQVLLTNRRLLLASLSGFALVLGQAIFAGYTELFLYEEVGLPIGAASAALASLQASGVAARIVWGALSDRYLGGDGRVLLGALSLGGAAAAAAMAWTGDGGPTWLALFAAVLAGWTAVGWNGLWVTLLSEVAGPENAGTALGIGLTGLQVGLAVAPPAFGFLVDRTGSYPFAWLVLGAVLASNILVVRQLLRERPGDRGGAMAAGSLR
ncbi:MAG: MFS transporter [Clostridia bacterium]|nr:MFS transporter [Clostridia bacterium]